MDIWSVRSMCSLKLFGQNWSKRLIKLRKLLSLERKTVFQFRRVCLLLRHFRLLAINNYDNSMKMLRPRDITKMDDFLDNNEGPHLGLGGKVRKKKQKIVLTFSEESRRDFLTGFRKRKAQRREKAKYIAELKEKEKKRQEVKEKRDKIKERVNQLMADGVLPEENKVNVLGEATTVDLGTHNVTITSSIDFGSSGLVLGDNESQKCDKETEQTQNSRTHQIDDYSSDKKKPKKALQAKVKTKRSKKFLRQKKKIKKR